jgi:AbrB family looped-hinge helix DNA binding protein
MMQDKGNKSRSYPSTTITISPAFQIEIPKQIRESLKLQPGQQIQAFQHEGRIELVPIPSIEKARGFLRGIDTTVTREADRL